MGTLASMGSLSVVAWADDMEPEDMKIRRLAALEEFGARNPEYQRSIKVQMRLERSAATEAKQQEARPWRRITLKGRKGHRPAQVKKSRWTTESSLGLLDAVTRFEKSESRAIGKEKWGIIAADLIAEQPGGPLGVMSSAESAQYCRTRYCNMLSRRHDKGTSYALTTELREKLDQFSRLIRESRPGLLSRTRRTPSRKTSCATALQKKSRMLRLATLKSKSAITMK